jgi:LuxR family maltose regulon positive regulatory protein
MLIHLAMGNLNIVENWVNMGSKEFEINEDMRLAEMGPLIVTLAINNRGNLLDELMLSLDGFSSTSMERDIQRQMIKVNIQKAVVFHAQKKPDQALSIMENALAMGKNEGYVRIFIDHGRPMEEILKKAIRSGMEVAYANELLSNLQADSQMKGIQPRHQESEEHIERLTERETEVLRFLSTDLPIPEIANELIITIGTLRTHIKRIYSKLNAHSRFEAVSRAKELDLLGS